MICFDDRMTKICGELFHFLKSSEPEIEIHRKRLYKREYRTGSVTCHIDIGFIRIHMIWKPLKIVNDNRSGSDEGANVFIYLPFSSSGLSSDTRYQIPGYYSERSNKPSLTVVVDDINKNTRRGPRRVVRQDININKNSPI